MMRPLAGLRVVEVSCGLAASFAATLLADFGADVVVVEGPPGAGHPLRQITRSTSRPSPQEGSLKMLRSSRRWRGGISASSAWSWRERRDKRSYGD